MLQGNMTRIGVSIAVSILFFSGCGGKSSQDGGGETNSNVSNTQGSGEWRELNDRNVDKNTQCDLLSGQGNSEDPIAKAKDDQRSRDCENKMLRDIDHIKIKG